MRRVIALALTVGLLCSLTPASALSVPKHIDEFDDLPALPRLSDFAQMRTWQEEEIVTIYLDRPVDNLRANWLEYNNEHEEELEVNDELIAYLDTTGHKYQVGAHWTNAYAYETYVENDPTKDESRYQTMLRDSDKAEGYKVGDTMAQRDTMRNVGSTYENLNDTKQQKNDSAINEMRGYLYNDQPDKFTKHEVEFTYNPGSAASSNAQIEATIDTLKKLATQEAQQATDALGQKHYDQYGSRDDLNNYYCVKVEEPFYAVVKTLDDGKFCILSRYKYTTDVKNISVPSGFKLYRVNGYVTAWHPTYAASDGTSDGRYTVAYLSDQTIDGEKWTVAYGRNGKIQWFYLTKYNTELFGEDLGTAFIKFEPCNTGWFIREVTEQYEDGSYISAFYNRTGNGKLAYYKASEYFTDGSSPYSSSRQNDDDEPEDSYDDEDLTPEDDDLIPYEEEDEVPEPSDFDDLEESEEEDFDEDGSDEEDSEEEDFDEFAEDADKYYVYEYEDMEEGYYGVLHTADCPLVHDRDMEDWHWSVYSASDIDLSLFRSMYKPCKVCNP